MSEMQREALAALAEVWSLAPDVRLGQLTAHLGFLSEVHVGRDLWNVDDDKLVAVMDRHLTELKARLAGDPNPTPPPTGSGVSVSGGPILSGAVPGG